MFKRVLSLILCAVFMTTAMFITSASGEEGNIAGDINRDKNVDNKDVVALFRHLNGDAAEVDETACDTNGDGSVDNKDVVVLFRHVSDPSVTIYYGKEDVPPMPEYDNVYNVWNSSVENTITNANQTEVTVKNNGIYLKYTGTSKMADPHVLFNISEYARIMNKRALTGADGSYIVIKLKSNTDGDFQVFTKNNGGETKTVYYKPDGKFHYIIIDMSTTKFIAQDTLESVRLDWGSSKTQPGAEAVITEIGFFETLEGALDYAAVIAGTQSGIVRDGTPKKYVTMSFDDATKQDLKVIEILKKYDIPTATFFINTGLCGHDWSANVSQMVGKQVEHIRFTMDELRTGIYDGYDLESHTLTHPSMKQYDNNPDMIKKELITDALNIFNLTGIYPAGLAWPGSSAEETNTTRKLVYENTNLRFGRGTTFQNGIKNRFKLPTEFLIWEPTNSMSNSSVISLFQKFLSKECTEDMMFYGFAHGFEFDVNNSWDIFEQFIQMVSQAQKSGDIIVVSNAEFYQLFKDQIPAYIPAE